MPQYQKDSPMSPRRVVVTVIVIAFLVCGFIVYQSHRSTDQLGPCNLCTGWGQKGTMMRDICDEQNNC